MATSVKTNVVSSPSIKDYIFTEKLGSGTYATVYKAYRKNGPRQVVAVKCVLKSSLNRASTENLLTEIELLKTLRHAHIVELKDFRWDANYIYLIMEYCGGGDLSAFIKSRRTLSEYLAKRFLQQIALALQYMRKMNVSHMDLKPQNILLSTGQQPCLKIGDFGFAHYLIGETATPYLRGSPLYMAPEMVLTKQYDEKADLWSVGVILYECLFGRAPFASRTLEELGVKIKDSKPVELPTGVQVSDKCRDLLHGLLQRSPDHRISFDEFFAHPFVDLEHRPSDNAINKATELITRAVEKDKNGEYQAAVNYYCQSLEYFIPAIHHQTNPQKKDALRQRIRQYIERAEELKQLLKPKTPGRDASLSRSLSDDASITQFKELVKLSCDNETMSAAFTVIESAQQKETRDDYEGALDQYQLALESLIKLLPEEPKGRRRELLQKQLPRWMSQAESIKQYLEVKDLKTKDTSAQEEEDDQRFLSVVQQQMRHDNMAAVGDMESGQDGAPRVSVLGRVTRNTPTKRPQSAVETRELETRFTGLESLTADLAEDESAQVSSSSSTFGETSSDKSSPHGSPSKYTTLREQTGGVLPKKKSFLKRFLWRRSSADSKETSDKEASPAKSDKHKLYSTLQGDSESEISEVSGKYDVTDTSAGTQGSSKYTSFSSPGDELQFTDEHFKIKTKYKQENDVPPSVTSGTPERAEADIHSDDDDDTDERFGKAKPSGLSKYLSHSPIGAAKLPSLPRPKLSGSPAKYETFKEKGDGRLLATKTSTVAQQKRGPSLSPEVNKPGYNTLDYYTSDSDSEDKTDKKNESARKSHPEDKNQTQTPSPKRLNSGSKLTRTNAPLNDSENEAAVDETHVRTSRGFDNIGFRTSMSQHSMAESPSVESFGSHGDHVETKWSLMQKQKKPDSQCVIQ